MLIDSHCHLNYATFKEQGIDADTLIAEAAENGVGKLLTICTHQGEFAELQGIAARHTNVFCTFGVHPHSAGADPLVAQSFDDALTDPNCVGVGETGLDYFRNEQPRDEQIASFELHLQKARKHDVPVVIHTRDAEEDTIAVLKNALADGPLRLLFHCFTASQELADFGVENGIYISAPGIITFKNKKLDALRNTFSTVPLELLLVETDAPFLAPEPNRGKINRPSYVKYTAEKLAELKQIDMETLADVTTKNFHQLFSRVPH